MSMPVKKFPNRVALREAVFDIYLNAMRDFIIFNLKKIRGRRVEDIVIEALEVRAPERADEIYDKLQKSDIEDIIDVADIPHCVQQNWNTFRNPLNLDHDKAVCNQLWLIKEARVKLAHPSKQDVESEWTRANLFLIADVLGKINKLTEKQAVEAIRDNLFADDTPERLAEAEGKLAEREQQLSDTQEQLDTLTSETTDLKSENEQLQQSLEAAKKDKQTAEAENQTLKEKLKNADTELKTRNASEERLKEQLKDAEKTVSTETEKREIAEQNLEHQRAHTNQAIEQRSKLEATLTITSIGDNTIIPPLGTDSPARLLDRRGIHKANYLLDLLNQKQPTIIYAQTQEGVNRFFDIVKQHQPDIAPLIRRHTERTTETEEQKLLKKLQNGELIAAISNATFSTLTWGHSLQHFVLCYPAPGMEIFYKQCEPAFAGAEPAYLHLIYNIEQDMDGLNKQYPNRETLKGLYIPIKDLASNKFMASEQFYGEIRSKTELSRTTIKTAITIFTELKLLQHNENGIRLSPSSPPKTDLENSDTYRLGEHLKKQTADFQTFQQQHTLDQMWDAILNTLNIDPAQLL